MNTTDLIRLGVPLGEAQRRAVDFISQFILRGGDKSRLEEEIKAIVAHPVSLAITAPIQKAGGLAQAHRHPQ